MIGSQSRRWVLLAGLLVLCLVALPATLRGESAGAQDAGEVAIDIADFAFEPGTIEVPVGTTLTWTNRGDAPHTVTADDGSFDVEVDASASATLTAPEEPGSYAFTCTIHPKMKGTLNVS